MGCRRILPAYRARQISIPFVKKGIGFFEVTGKEFSKLQVAHSESRHAGRKAHSWLNGVADAMRLICWH